MLVANEDIEEGGLPINWREVPNYVKVYPTPYNPAIEPNQDKDINQLMLSRSLVSPELNAKGKRIIYVENALTGELTPVYANAPTSLDYDIDGDKVNTDDNDESELAHMLPHDKQIGGGGKKQENRSLGFPYLMALYLRVIYFFIHGMLAGFSFTTLYLENAVTTALN
jgi:hypothetical protein